MAATEDFAEYVAKHQDLELLPSGKCRCKLTGHEMGPVMSLVEVSGPCGAPFGNGSQPF